MKICNKVFNGGIDIVVSPYHYTSQKNIWTELCSYLNEIKLINDRHSMCYMNIEAFFRSIKSDIMNGEKDKNYFLSEYYKDATIIMSDLKKYLEFNESLKRLLVERNIQVFIIVGSSENISYEDFGEFPYHFFYMTEAKDIFGRVLFDVEDKEVFKGWKK